MSDHSSTYQVLQDYLSIVNTPKKPAVAPSAPPQPQTYNHPDIQYFQRIKAKNHFNYHKSKHSSKAVETVQTRMTVFDPYSHEQLIARLRTFSPMNWRVPEEEDPSRNSKSFETELNELKCARNGWKCVSFSLHSSKNHLLCTNCNAQLVLKFDIQKPNDTLSMLFPFEETAEETTSLNSLLKEKYLKDIITEGHTNECSWRNFETPLEGIYYLRPYISITNEILINDFVKTLKNLIDNSMVLTEFSQLFEEKFLAHSLDAKVVAISNQWLIQKYFKDNKENLSLILEKTPKWIYNLAFLGWSLNVQGFSNQIILLLICNKCNQRVFLNPETLFGSTDHASPYFNLSTSKILTPCKYPIPSSTNQDFETKNPDENRFNPYTEHKVWCCHSQSMTSSGPEIKVHTYLEQVLVNSKQNIGTNGEYIRGDDDLIMETDTGAHKRSQSFDIIEGLERFNKLRKLYLMDDKTS